MRDWIVIVARYVVAFGFAWNSLMTIFAYRNGTDWHYSAFWAVIFLVATIGWEIEAAIKRD